jgi:nitrite reductase (NADH) small subunit
MADFMTVAKVSELKPGEVKVVEADGKTIALFNVGGKFHAIDNTCKHQGGPLGEGMCEGNIVTCPWHGWQYNVETGENVANAQVKVDIYDVKVEGEEIKVKAN